MRSQIMGLILALLIGLGVGLAYSWLISPVTYVDANPAILRSDFKDQYRIVIAASYVSTLDLERARARLELLGGSDPIGEMSAQAQRMVGGGESIENMQPLVQLAADLKQGAASIPSTKFPPTDIPFVSTPFTNIINTPTSTADNFTANTPTEEPITTETQTTLEANAPTPTTSFAQTALAPVAASPFAPRPTFTPVPPPGAPFMLTNQETICEPGSQSGVMQFILMDKRRKQMSGIEIIITSSQGEDHSFTGFKPELGNGYADFVMQADTIYSIRVVEGGTSVPNISAPICKDPNGETYPGSLLLIFQQP
jgi:hypothetical protein